VLVVTLGLLVLSSTLLVAVGRMAVQHALAAREAQEELQRRWGVISCQQAVMPFAEKILANAEAQQKRPVPLLKSRVLMGNQSFDLIVADEQAKANVNAMLESMHDRSTVESHLRQGMSGSGLVNNIHLHPAPIKTASTQPASQPASAPMGVPRWIDGMGQVFDSVTPGQLVSSGSAPPAQRLTCWGTGAINILRASEASLQLAASPPLTQIEIGHLIEVRNGMFSGASSSLSDSDVGKPRAPASGDALSALLSQARIDPAKRPKLSITTLSACHSLWVLVGDGRRTWYYLAVEDESNPQKPHVQSFVW
jgi:hypothetical protein